MKTSEKTDARGFWGGEPMGRHGRFCRLAFDSGDFRSFLVYWVGRNCKTAVLGSQEAKA